MSAYNGYSNTSYGGGGGEDGGGFVYGSQQGSQSAARPVNDESLRPVTIKQLIDAEPAYSSPDAAFRIDGADIKQVTFVGMVRSVSPQTTNITYKLDDGTGLLEVKQWIDADKQDGENRPSFPEESYVRVWGRLKSFGAANKRHVGAHVIKAVKDFNEVNYHLLEATYVHLYFTRGGGPGADGGNADNGDSMFVDGGEGSYDPNAAKTQSYSAKARKMYNYLNNASSNEGIHINVIARETSMSVQDVMTAADELQGHGSIYTTIDDETFAILEGY
ncbi:replication protein A, subunit RPA32 [Xylariaceae sp. FL0016]|nr:replication protein A, subunit RPA32 [Xylariaceae sp. FL0016]